jgi:predicted HTH domain antitoxin
MKSVTEELGAMELPPFVDASEGRLMMAMKFFELGRLSLGQAARVAGCSKAGFVDMLARHDIPVVDYPVDQLAEEVDW